MRCPRCNQESSVEPQGEANLHGGRWACHACSLTFFESTQVFRPISTGSKWVERGSGTLVTVLSVTGDSFDPGSAIRYQQGSDDVPKVMLAQDFRFYFRVHQVARPKATCPPCRVGEEWESKSGQIYTVLDVDPKDGSVHVLREGVYHRSFWIEGSNFGNDFHRFERRTDFSRLLDD